MKRCEYLFSVDPNQSHALQCTCKAIRSVSITYLNGTRETKQLCGIHAETTEAALTWRGHTVEDDSIFGINH